MITLTRLAFIPLLFLSAISAFAQSPAPESGGTVRSRMPYELPDSVLKQQEAEEKAREEAAPQRPGRSETALSSDDSARTWYYSYNEATQAAARNKRQILLIFETEWCNWCKAMSDTTWADPSVLNFAKNLVFTRVDAEIDTLLAQRYHVQRYPTAILMSDQGIEADRFVGYFPPEEFREELTRAMEGSETVWEYERLLKERSDLQVMLKVAREYLERGEPQRANEYVQRVKSMDVDGGLGALDDALFVEAMLERESRKWYKALELLKKLVKNHPDSPWREESELYIPWLLAQAGDEEEALKKYNEYLESYGSSRETEWVKRQIARLETAEADALKSAPEQQEGN